MYRNFFQATYQIFKFIWKFNKLLCMMIKRHILAMQNSN